MKIGNVVNYFDDSNGTNGRVGLVVSKVIGEPGYFSIFDPKKKKCEEIFIDQITSVCQLLLA